MKKQLPLVGLSLLIFGVISFYFVIIDGNAWIPVLLLSSFLIIFILWYLYGMYKSIKTIEDEIKNIND